MKTQFYTLPELNFVGGETQKHTLTLQKASGQKYDLPEAQASLSVVEFVNPHSSPALTMRMMVTPDASGTYCEVVIHLDPEDTVDLAGKYIYQVTVMDAGGNTSIPQKGIMHIAGNIDKWFITGGGDL